MISNKDCWVPIPEDSDFSIYNIPFGVFSDSDTTKRVGVGIGEHIIDLSIADECGLFDHLKIDKKVFKNEYLNDFISLGKRVTSKVRTILQKELVDTETVLKNYPKLLIAKENATMHLPVLIRDYTDFYSSIEHATNVGIMFRGPENALMPNWKHIPVGYHGRASSIIVSGEHIHRPMGQTLPPDQITPIYSASKRVDFELEMGYIIGKGTQLGDTLNTKNAEDYIFGKVLFNDWSARDVQKWEYVPLGPFLSKNFASSISPWVVTMEALEYFRVEGPEQDPAVLTYLEFTGKRNYDINLEVALQPKDKKETVVSNSNFKYMYWNMAQQLAHHTMNGCNLNVGDMMGSGTISGKSHDSYGSMAELTWGGKNPIKLNDGSERKFIEDNDSVIMRGYCVKDDKRIGFGEVRTKLLPSKNR